MRKTSRFSVPMICLLGGALLAAVLFSGRRAESQQAGAANPPVKWEYSSNVIDANSLQAKFGEMANAGWEIQSVQINESVLDTGVEAKPRIVVEKYLVVARRPAK